MINYELFEFAAAPRTGTTWVIHAARFMGLGEGFKAHVHVPFEGKSDLYRVSTVRHPCTWLASYFTSIHRGFLAVPAVDRFCRLPTDDFDDFVREYLRFMPGEIGQMFLDYNANSYMRMEDLPWAFVELMESLGIPTEKADECLGIPVQNQTMGKKTKPMWNKQLWKRVTEAEKEMMEAYGYGE